MLDFWSIWLLNLKSSLMYLYRVRIGVVILGKSYKIPKGLKFINIQQVDLLPLPKLLDMRGNLLHTVIQQFESIHSDVLLVLYSQQSK